MSKGDIIRLLPDSVANQIAAGEVIQRPASVIKELVENSVDAGAKNIEIIVKDAGKTLIQVVDDGKGMSVTDARMAFERHATSKIRCADDLFSLCTMGFRGEALPSIAAVSELELTSRREDDDLGTRLVIRASKVESQEPVTAASGTVIKVRNLFYNFVARRRFLKRDNIELSHIVHEFERLALVNTDVAFKFTSNGTLLHSLSRGPLKNRIGALFGKSVSETLIPVHVETSLVCIDGFVSLPQAARQRGQRQFLFVNGRNMRHPYFHKAILSCYDNLIAKDVQPHYFITFKVPADRIDVNIHPQKHEIKFEDEQSIWQILTSAVRDALGRSNVTAAIDFNNTGAPDIPPLVEGGTPPANLDSLTDNGDTPYNPFELRADKPQTQARFDFGSPGETMSRPSRLNGATYGGADMRRRDTQSPEGWQQMFRPIERADASVSVRSETPDLSLPGMDDAAPATLVQLRKKYIVTETHDGLLLIDQHRAHVNILFESLSDEISNSQAAASQALVFPEPLDLDAGQRVMLDSSIDIVERIGFRISYDDSGAAMLESIPGTLQTGNPAAVLKDILADLEESGVDIEDEAMRRVILTMARSAAIKSGRVLTTAEMEHIVSALFRLPHPGYTPEGLTVIYRLTDDRLDTFFS